MAGLKLHSKWSVSTFGLEMAPAWLGSGVLVLLVFHTDIDTRVIGVLTTNFQLFPCMHIPDCHNPISTRLRLMTWPESSRMALDVIGG